MWQGNVTEAALSRQCKDSDADSQPDVESLGDGGSSSEMRTDGGQEASALLTRAPVSHELQDR